MQPSGLESPFSQQIDHTWRDSDDHGRDHERDHLIPRTPISDAHEAPSRWISLLFLIAPPLLTGCVTEPTRLLVFALLTVKCRIIVKAFDIAFLATNYPHLCASCCALFSLIILTVLLADHFIDILASDLQHFKDAPWVMLTDSICSAAFVPLVSSVS